MNTEQLLKTRYIAVFKNGHHYPNSPYVEGEIFTESDYGSDILISNYGRFLDAKIAKNHPSLFKPLEWWEERPESEMPEYVRLNPINTPPYDSALFSKVYSWCNGNVILELAMGGKCTLHASYLLPATLSDYTAYINQTKA